MQTDKIALQKEMSGMVDRLRDRSPTHDSSHVNESSHDVAIEIGDENDLTEIIIN